MLSVEGRAECGEAEADVFRCDAPWPDVTLRCCHDRRVATAGALRTGVPFDVVGVRPVGRDRDHLLRLIGMLGSPNGPGFWDSWRTDLNGYAFKKMKTYVTRCSQQDVSPHLVSGFGGYVLTFFSIENAEAEAALVEKVGRYIDAHDENQPVIQFLIDLRATAWRLMRDNSRVPADTVAKEWERAELKA